MLWLLLNGIRYLIPFLCHALVLLPHLFYLKPLQLILYLREWLSEQQPQQFLPQKSLSLLKAIK